MSENNALKEALIYRDIHNTFSINQRITNKELKIRLQAIYDRYQYRAKGKAKGSDITKFGFRTKKCKIRIGKDRIDGVELSTLDQILQNDNNKTNDEETNQ